MTAKLFDEVGAALRRAPRRLHPHPEARPPPRRQRADGPHRARLSPRSTGLTARPRVSRTDADPAAARVDGRPCGCGCSSPTTGPASTASPRTPASPRSAARCGAALERVLRPPGRADRAPAAPTPACTPGARSCRFDAPADGLDLVAAAALASTGCAARRSPCARPRWPRPTSTPASRPVWRRYRYTVLNRDGARPVPGRDDLARRPRRSTCGRCAWPATRSSASTTSRRSAGGRRRGRRAAAAPPLVRRVPRGRLDRRRRRPAALRDRGQRLLPPDGALASSARWSTWASGRRQAGDVAGHPAGPRPGRGRPARPAPRPVPLGGRLRRCPHVRRRSLVRAGAGVTDARRERRWRARGALRGEPCRHGPALAVRRMRPYPLPVAAKRRQ